ncbi:oligosaccharide flippase family protein [Brumicola pallidula]|uniref:oligosaccharide flippase family protein n=1 Tax=Brumicola pallidula TaxID=56807 RepID=UPI003CC7F8F9
MASLKLPVLQFENKRLLSNVGWLLGSEMAAKFSRLFVILILAAQLSAIEYGTIMLALACHEVLKLVLRSGAGSQIVQCNESQLSEFVRNGAVLQWLICLSLAAFQVALAFPIAIFYDNAQLSELLILMALAYIPYPLVSVKVFLLHRASKMRYYSICNALCILAENTSIGIFALLDFGIMSVVYGKWVFVALWLILFYFAPVKNYGIGFNKPIFLSLIKSSGQLLSTELIRALRLQLDVLIGARLLSPELFGVYSFAKSAGVGLSQSLNNAFNSGLYPYLCNKHRQDTLPNFTLKIYAFASLVAFTFIFQAIAVPFYVPILFEQQWQQSYSTVAFLCCSALPAIYIDTHCNILRAKAEYQYEMYVRIFCLVTSAIGLLLFNANTPIDFALSVLIMSVVCLLVLLIQHCFSRRISIIKFLFLRSHLNE